MNTSFDSVLKGKELPDVGSFASFDSCESTPEFGRVQAIPPVDRSICLIQESQTKRSIEAASDIDEPPVKKHKQESKVERHEHSASCWRENTPTPRPTSSTVWNEVKRSTNKCTMSKKYTLICILPAESGNKPCHALLNLNKAEGKKSWITSKAVDHSRRMHPQSTLHLMPLLVQGKPNKADQMLYLHLV